MKRYLNKILNKTAEIYAHCGCITLCQDNTMFVNFGDGLDKHYVFDIIIVAKTTRPDPFGHGGF